MDLCLQGLSKSLAAAKEQLQQARRGFEALVAYFGENPAALQNDGDFWPDVIAFVTAFSTAQQGALAFKKVDAFSASAFLLCQPLLVLIMSSKAPAVFARAGSGGMKVLSDNPVCSLLHDLSALI